MGRVQQGDVIDIERTSVSDGQVEFDRVLMIGEAEAAPKIGTPTVEGAKVTASIVAEVKDALAGVKDFPGITGGMTFTPDGDPKKCAVIVQINDEGQFAFHKSVCPK